MKRSRVALKLCTLSGDPWCPGDILYTWDSVAGNNFLTCAELLPLSLSGWWARSCFLAKRNAAECYSPAREQCLIYPSSKEATQWKQVSISVRQDFECNINLLCIEPHSEQRSDAVSDWICHFFFFFCLEMASVNKNGSSSRLQSRKPPHLSITIPPTEGAGDHKPARVWLWSFICYVKV